MIDSNNILLITDDDEVAGVISSKLVLLREKDKITVADTSTFKKILNNSLHYVVILHEAEDENTTLKLISKIKDTKSDAEVILLLNNTNPQLVLDAYDAGVFDYFYTDTDSYEMLIKTVNCFKLHRLKEIQKLHEKFLYQFGVLDTKNNFYQYKYLKEIFVDISCSLSIQNGVFVLLTLDEKNKTKISTSRLANSIKNSLRQDDIVSIARGGKFYLILPNINLEGAKKLIDKIQNVMGEEYKLRSGLAKIGINSFETLDKNANDALISSVQNDTVYSCLNNEYKDDWLSDGNDIPKGFKLFQSVYNSKIDNVIKPLFFRFQKEYSSKLTNTSVTQYSNDLESVFCIKTDDFKSELSIKLKNYVKFQIEIIHSGLDSAENSKDLIPLNQMNEKYLTDCLKKLKNEYKKSVSKRV